MNCVLSEELYQYIDDWCLNIIKWVVNPAYYGDDDQSSNLLKNFFVNSKHYLYTNSCFYVINQENEAHVQCLLELTAVMLGSPECSSHFWTHLVIPDTISTDFVPGCMVCI